MICVNYKLVDTNLRRYIDLQESRCHLRTQTERLHEKDLMDLSYMGPYLGGHHCLYACVYLYLICTCLSISPNIGSQYPCKMLQAYVSAWITVSVDHVVVLTKDRPFSVVQLIVDYYIGSVNPPVKKQGSHGQGLCITLAPWLRGFHIWNHCLYFMTVSCVVR